MCGSSFWRIRSAIRAYTYIRYKVLARPSRMHTHVHRLGGKCHMLIVKSLMVVVSKPNTFSWRTIGTPCLKQHTM